MCRPMRTRIGPALEACGQRRCAAASAPGAVGKAKKNASPCVSTSTPPCGGARLAHDPAVLGERVRVRALRRARGAAASSPRRP